MGRIDAESETLIPIGGSFDEPTSCLETTSHDYSRADGFTAIPIAHALRADGFDASEDGTGRGTPLVPISFAHTVAGSERTQVHDTLGLTRALTTRGLAVAFSAKDCGADAGEIAPTIRAGGHVGSHANGGVMPAIAAPITSSMGKSIARAGKEVSVTNGIVQQMQVRRLTPRECERLQGFHDDYTLIPFRKKPAADGPRYKALGNSMATNVMQWIGRRIAMVESIPSAPAVESVAGGKLV